MSDNSIDPDSRQALVILPVGITHVITTGRAESWAAWDALRGPRWRDEEVHVDEHGDRAVHPSDHTTPTRQKTGVVRGHRVLILPPKTYYQQHAA